MFKIKRPNLRYMTEPIAEGGGDTSGGEVNSLGGTTPVEAPQETSHPWDSHLESFPEQFRPVASNAFSQMEKDFNKRFEAAAAERKQYEPYKNFIEQGISPEDLSATYQFAVQWQNDPQGFVRQLAEHAGLTIAEAQQVAEELQEQQGEVDPQIEALQKQQEEMRQMFEQQALERQQQELDQQMTQNIESEIAMINQKYGQMSPDVLNEVLNRAYALSLQTNQQVSLEQAYLSLEAFMSKVQQAPRPGASAPRVTPSGNNMPVTPAGKSPGQWSDSETKAAAAAVAARVLGQGN